jgi:uncharacterized membrane protein YeaQ/YmgE (transglycosylase-associated protein family)
MLDFLVLLVIGLIVGALGRAVVPGKQSMPLWLTMLIGVGSLLLAGLVFGSLLLKVVIGTLVAAVIIALTQGSLKSRRHA